jgi:hypothetical protein
MVGSAPLLERSASRALAFGVLCTFYCSVALFEPRGTAHPGPDLSPGLHALVMAGIDVDHEVPGRFGGVFGSSS